MTSHRAVCLCGAPLVTIEDLAAARGVGVEAVRKAAQRDPATLPQPVLGGGRGRQAWWCGAHLASDWAAGVGSDHAC